jgi:YegS/Rv2252/BmrU family lipid kinase
MSEVSQRPRALVVANPIAGRGKAEPAAREVLAGLEAAGYATTLLLTTAAGDGIEAAAKVDARTELVVSVGGDGTLREVLEGLGRIGIDARVAVLPFGTANVLGRDLLLPRDAAGLLEVIERGNTTSLDVADVNGALSFLCVGVGPDAEMVKAVDDARDGPIRFRNYVFSVRALFKTPRRRNLIVTLDGELLPGRFGFVLASNMIHYGGLFRLGAERKLGDGKFEVYLFEKASIPALAGYALRAFLGRLPGGSCTMRRAKEIGVEADSAVPYQVDGDPGGVTPVRIRVTDRRVRLCVP